MDAQTQFNRLLECLKDEVKNAVACKVYPSEQTLALLEELHETAFIEQLHLDQLEE